ncbi:hypothetical protein [Mycolicibacterium sp.]|uniref:hypothetical protein n=1 Tax=Mycolicibacterium sp. TaxID=2320850 RepID=UPI0037C954F5
MRRNSLDDPLNDIEQLHHGAIVAAGNDPDDWLIDAQIRTWELRHGYPLTSGEEVELRRLSLEAASRYERSEYLQFYSLAATYVATMQEMSFDRQDFQPAPFRVATQPGSYIEPWVAWHARTDDDSGQPPPDPIIWVPAGALIIFANVIEVFTGRIVRAFDDLPALIKAVGEQSWAETLAALRAGPRRPAGYVPTRQGRCAVHFPPPIDRRSLLPHVARIDDGIKAAVTTFVIGHEAGHLHLGHFGDRRRFDPFVGGEPIDPGLRRETGSDTVGVCTVWDGMSAHGHGSIDATWIGPVLALATSAGLAAAYPIADQHTTNDTWHDWVYRLSTCVRGLGAWMFGNGFSYARTCAVLGAAVPLAAAVYEYMRTGGELRDATDRLGAPGVEIHAELERAALAQLKRFE